MNCFNCTNAAIYYYSVPEASDVYYCHLCLPEHLKAAADRGDLAIPAPAEPAKPSKKSAPADAPVDPAQ